MKNKKNCSTGSWLWKQLARLRNSQSFLNLNPQNAWHLTKNLLKVVSFKFVRTCVYLYDVDAAVYWRNKNRRFIYLFIYFLFSLSATQVNKEEVYYGECVIFTQQPSLKSRETKCTCCGYKNRRHNALTMTRRRVTKKIKIKQPSDQ